MTLPVAGRAPLTVSQATALVRGALAASPELEDILIEGELSNLRQSAPGHLYFTLKDRDTALRSVCFRNQARAVAFRPENGMTVIAHGRIDVYEAGGEYQLYVDRLEPSGLGALALAVDQCRRRLAREGLLDDRLKRPLPLLPRRVAVVTSRSGAAFRDVCTVVGRRAATVDIVLSPATVQGEGAASTLVTALDRAQRVAGADVILLVRGGGSLEDLMPFNDERLARAIRASTLPVVTGIGHQTDLTIADQVADRRAPTPSAAAEVAVPSAAALRAEIAARSGRLGHAARRLVDGRRRGAERLAERLHRASPSRRLPERRQRLDAATVRLERALVAMSTLERRRLDAALARLGPSLGARVGGERRRLDALTGRLGVALGGRIGAEHRRLDGVAARLRLRSPLGRVAVQHEALRGRGDRLDRSWAAVMKERRAGLTQHRARLDALSPERVIRRGYSLTLDEASGRLVTRVGDLRPGQRLRLRLSDGSVRTEVVEVLPS